MIRFGVKDNPDKLKTYLNHLFYIQDEFLKQRLNWGNPISTNPCSFSLDRRVLDQLISCIDLLKDLYELENSFSFKSVRPYSNNEKDRWNRVFDKFWSYLRYGEIYYQKSGFNTPICKKKLESAIINMIFVISNLIEWANHAIEYTENKKQEDYYTFERIVLGAIHLKRPFYDISNAKNFVHQDLDTSWCDHKDLHYLHKVPIVES